MFEELFSGLTPVSIARAILAAFFLGGVAVVAKRFWIFAGRLVVKAGTRRYRRARRKAIRRAIQITRDPVASLAELMMMVFSGVFILYPFIFIQLAIIAVQLGTISIILVNAAGIALLGATIVMMPVSVRSLGIFFDLLHISIVTRDPAKRARRREGRRRYHRRQKEKE